MAAAVGIRPRLPTEPAVVTLAGQATESDTPPKTLRGKSVPSESSYTPTIASWSTQSGQPSDCTRRLSFETARSVISSTSSDSSEEEDVDEPGNESDSSERTWTQSPPAAQREIVDEHQQDELRPAAWPIFVQELTTNDNPREYRVGVVAAGKPCECTTPCNALSCKNALSNRCCTEDNCSFSGIRGNSLKQNPNLVLSMRRTSGEFGVTAAGLIAAGEVIGEYRGYITELGDLESRAAVDNGYRMLVDTPTIDGKSIGIDTLWCGTIMRFVNHHCNPNARFLEVRVGQRLAVVVVTLRDVWPGEEVTVSYGDQLWFICRCGWWGCQHRHLQHL